MRHLIETTDLSDAEVRETLTLAAALKKGDKPPIDFAGKAMALLFLNPSLRTRVSFVRAMEQLGGSALAMDAGKDTWKMVFERGVVMDGDGVEHVREAVPVLSRYCDFLGIRAFGERKDFEIDRKDAMIRTCAEFATVPFVNLESAMAHPCQAFADALTIQEQGISRPKVVLTWSYHPKALPMAVSNSFLLMATRMGWDVTLVRPEGYDLPPEVVRTARDDAAKSGGKFAETDDRSKAFEGANIVYVKSWGSISGYADPAGEAERKKSLKDWVVDRTSMAKTADAAVLHCLPVRRNVEISDDVLDSKASRVIDEAENRLHVQKAILLKLAMLNAKKGTDTWLPKS